MKLKTAILITVLFFAGCSVKQPQIGQKVFPQEDDYIIQAVLDDSEGNYKQAVDIYRFLYKKTKKRVYLEQIAADLFAMKKYKKVIELSENYYKEHKNVDINIFKYEIFALVNEKKLNRAKTLLLDRLDEKNSFFYSMMSYIFLQQNHYSEAVYYLKSLYALQPTKQNLLALTDVLIRLKKYNEALAYLRTHLNLYGCDYDVCMRLVFIYKSLYDYDNLASIYEKLGEFDPKYYLLAYNIFLQNNEYKKAENLIKKYGLNSEYLMFLYLKEGDMKKAAKIAYDLYKQSGDDKFLLKYCEFMYDANPSKKELLNIVKNLKILAKKYKNDYVYNFLAWILINNDINPKEGIKYAIKAVNMKPDDVDYIDTLAWGYYKTGKCKDAWDIIKEIDIQNPDIQMHKNMIKKCLIKHRKGKR